MQNTSIQTDRLSAAIARMAECFARTIIDMQNFGASNSDASSHSESQLLVSRLIGQVRPSTHMFGFRVYRDFANCEVLQGACAACSDARVRSPGIRMSREVANEHDDKHSTSRWRDDCGHQRADCTWRRERLSARRGL